MKETESSSRTRMSSGKPEARRNSYDATQTEWKEPDVHQDHRADRRDPGRGGPSQRVLAVDRRRELRIRPAGHQASGASGSLRSDGGRPGGAEGGREGREGGREEHLGVRQPGDRGNQGRSGARQREAGEVQRQDEGRASAQDGRAAAADGAEGRGDAKAPGTLTPTQKKALKATTVPTTKLVVDSTGVHTVVDTAPPETPIAK